MPRSIWERVRSNRFMCAVRRAVRRRIHIAPFVIFEEDPPGSDNPDVQPGVESCTLDFLSRDDVKRLVSHPEVPDTEASLMRRCDRGMRCLALRQGGEILAYMWCHTEDCRFSQWPFALSEGEAYLFDARTFAAYRGRNLAPYLRCCLCERLRTEGKTRFLSVSMWLNSSAMRFKQKIGARPVGTYLYVGLLHRWRFNIPLRRYPAPPVKAHGDASCPGVARAPLP